jgi:hypothetical protein
MKDFELYKDYLFSDIVEWSKEDENDLEEIGDKNVIGLTFLAAQCHKDNKTYSFVLSGYVTSKGGVYRLIFKE